MNRKLILLLLVISLTVASVFAGPSNWSDDIRRGYNAKWRSAGADNPLVNYLKDIDSLIGLDTGLGTGNIYYVDSGVAVEGSGISWETAKDTLDEAINLCTADNGDIILVAQGHAETITASSGIDADVAGITIIGCGEGDQRPTFTFGTAATADMDIDADDVCVYNCIFQSGKADLATMITITNDNVSIVRCVFRDSTAGLGAITIGAADGDSDRFTVANCRFYQPGTTNDHSIEVLFDMVGGRIIGNVFHGDYDEGAIAIPAGGDACLDLVIADNIITQLQASVMAIDIDGTSSTGVITRNVINSTSAYECDPGTLDELLNSYQMDIDISTNNLDHLMKTAVADDSGAIDLTEVVDKTVLSWILSGDGDTATFVPSTMALSVLATNVAAILADTAAADTAGELVVLAGTANVSTTGVTGAPTANTLADTLHKDGSFTYDNTTDSLEAIRDQVDALNVADQIDIDAILADTDAMQQSGEYCVSKALATIANGNNNLFTVSGGPVKIIEIVGYVTAEIEGKSCLINYNFDPTNPATDTVFATTGTALEINADAIGTLYTWDGVMANNLVATTNGVALGLPTYSGIVLPTGSLELAAVVDTSATGTITFYVRYKPLVPGATVTAQ